MSNGNLLYYVSPSREAKPHLLLRFVFFFGGCTGRIGHIVNVSVALLVTRKDIVKPRKSI